jgi:hypothetical protein
VIAAQSLRNRCEFPSKKQKVSSEGKQIAASDQQKASTKKRAGDSEQSKQHQATLSNIKQH